MKFEAERLILRRWEDSDAENLFEYAKDLYIAYVMTECLLLAINFLHYRRVMKKDMEKSSPKEDVLYLTVAPQDAVEASRSIREYAEAHGYSQRIAYRAALCMEEMIHYAEAVKSSGRVMSPSPGISAASTA